VHRDWLQCSGEGDNVCKWKAKLEALDSAFFVGEFQPWAFMGAEHGGQVMRVTYDTYVATAGPRPHGRGSGEQQGRAGQGHLGPGHQRARRRHSKLDFNKASLAEIENLFRLFGSVPYEPQQTAIKWMNATVPPNPFAK
jgi:glucan 1,3-beta-glucosidase